LRRPEMSVSDFTVPVSMSSRNGGLDGENGGRAEWKRGGVA